MRGPSRKHWPEGLRALARRRRGLYAQLELLRGLNPPWLLWVLRHWEAPAGQEVIELLLAEGTPYFLEAVEQGLINPASKAFAESTARVQAGSGSRDNPLDGRDGG